MKLKNSYPDVECFSQDGEWQCNPYIVWLQSQVALISWLSEPCTEHPYTGTNDYVYKNNKFYYKHRKDCPECWGKLVKELK